MKTLCFTIYFRFVTATEMKINIETMSFKKKKKNRYPTLEQMSGNKNWNKCLNKTNGEVKECPSLINDSGCLGI